MGIEKLLLANKASLKQVVTNVAVILFLIAFGIFTLKAVAAGKPTYAQFGHESHP